MTCQDVKDRDLVAEYANGRLESGARDAFEEHFLECQACFDDLQNYRLMRGVLAAMPAARLAWRRSSTWIGLAAAAVFALAIIATLRPGPDSPQPVDQAASTPAIPVPAPAAQPEVPAAIPSAPSRAVLVDQLARFEPPRYEPPALRGADDEARRRFAAAMDHYHAGDFTAASAALGALVRSGESGAEVAFYLAASNLEIGRTADAITGFDRVLSTGDLLFEEDAHFFLGKALLRQGEVSRARAEFAAVAALNGDRAQDARRLVSALDTLPSR